MSDLALATNTVRLAPADTRPHPRSSVFLTIIFGWIMGFALRLMMVFVVLALVRSPPGELR